MATVPRQAGAASLERLPSDVVLSVRDLSVEYGTRRGGVKAVRNVSFDLRKGESLALIGESGSGKTTLALSLIRLLSRSARITGGQILYQRDGQVVDVRGYGPEELRKFRWQECAMVFQSALNALNPVLKVRDHIYDTQRAHPGVVKVDIVERAAELMRLVQLDPNRVLNAYPHQLSGGMRQRVLLAMGLLLDPQVIILDEPTTALDILTQRAIIEVLRRLKRDLQFSMIFISHDLSLAAELADRIGTMYAGRIVELGDVDDAFYRPRHPYTLGLLKAVPTLAGDVEGLTSIPGSPPDLIEMPAGCKFHPRCPYMVEACKDEDPPLFDVRTPPAPGASSHPPALERTAVGAPPQAAGGAPREAAAAQAVGGAPQAVGAAPLVARAGSHVAACIRWRDVRREETEVPA
jgi:peptide/nickel transport system ATP-binding protein